MLLLRKDILKCIAVNLLKAIHVNQINRIKLIEKMIHIVLLFEWYKFIHIEIGLFLMNEMKDHKNGLKRLNNNTTNNRNNHKNINTAK